MDKAFNSLLALHLSSFGNSKVVSIISTNQPRHTTIICFENGQALAIAAIDGSYFTIRKYGDWEMPEETRIGAEAELKRDFDESMAIWYRNAMEDAKKARAIHDRYYPHISKRVELQ